MSCKRRGSVQVERVLQHNDSDSDEEEVCSAEQIAERKLAVAVRSTKLLDRVQRLRELDIKQRTDPSELGSESDFTSSSILTARLSGTLSLSPEPKSGTADHDTHSSAPRPSAVTDSLCSRVTGRGVPLTTSSGSTAQPPTHTQPQLRFKPASFVYNGRNVHCCTSATVSPTVGRSAPSSPLIGRSSASSPLIGRCRMSSSLLALKRRSNLSPCPTNTSDEVEARARTDRAAEEGCVSNISATRKKQKICADPEPSNGLRGEKVLKENCPAISTVSLGGLTDIQPLRNIISSESQDL